LEIDSPDEISESSLLDELYPKRLSPTKSGFSKPARAGRGAQRLTKTVAANIDG